MVLLCFHSLFYFFVIRCNIRDSFRVVELSSLHKDNANRKQYKISLLIFNIEVKPGLLKSRNNFGVF